ncbi:MAG: energy-coupling factor transporter transmembrane component T [Thermofilaceae archaeon]
MPTILGELAGVESKSSRYLSLHVSTKIFLPLSFAVAIFFATDPIKALLLVAASAGACVAAGVPLGAIKRYLAVIVSMSSFIVLAFSLFTHIPGKTLFEVTLLSMRAEKGVFEWKLSLTDTGLTYALTFILRIFAMILSATLLMATVTDRDLVWGLLSLKVPFGACVATSLFFRGLQLFASDFYTIREAMMARGVDFERTSLAKRFLLYVNALIPLLSLMITRSYEVSLALESRGIAPSSRAASGYYTFKMRRDDYAVIAVSVTLIIAYVLWGWIP